MQRSSIKQFHGGDSSMDAENNLTCWIFASDTKYLPDLRNHSIYDVGNIVGVHECLSLKYKPRMIEFQLPQRKENETEFCFRSDFLDEIMITEGFEAKTQALLKIMSFPVNQLRRVPWTLNAQKKRKMETNELNAYLSERERSD